MSTNQFSVKLDYVPNNSADLHVELQQFSTFHNVSYMISMFQGPGGANPEIVFTGNYEDLELLVIDYCPHDKSEVDYIMSTFVEVK